MLSWFPRSPVTSEANATKEPLSGGIQSENSNEQPRTEEALPHDRILGTLFRPQDRAETNGPGSQDASTLDTHNVVYDPFDGSFIGSLLPHDLNVQPEDGKLSEVASKNEELWTSLSRVLELQNQISRMHLDMEDVGMNTERKGKGKGTRSRATSVSRVVIDDVEGDEGIGGKRDEEAEKNKAMELQFETLAAQFRNKKEAINGIMTKEQLDSLSRAVTEFHALQAPKIDFPSRDNSLSVTDPTLIDTMPALTNPATINPTLRKPSLPPGVQLLFGHRSKQPNTRPTRQRAKTLPPAYHNKAMPESDNSQMGHGFEGSGRLQTAEDSETTARGPSQDKLPLIQDASLSRHGTLLSSGATTLKRAAELKSLLGNANSRLRPGALVVSQRPDGQEPTSFEQAKPRARVEIDIVLHSNMCVEGGIIKGFIKLRIRPRMKKESVVSISDGKVRIIGFESTEGDYHEFFQHSAALSEVVTYPPRIYNSPPDSEGFFTAGEFEGVHSLGFEMPLPMNGVRRPQGPFHGPSGVSVRYIALVSIKVKDEFEKRSIAHFYRDCEIWPRLDPSVILAPADQPIQASVSKRIFMGGTGEVRLTSALHRSCFIAGTHVPVSVKVQNDTKKLIKSLSLTLHQSVVVFKRKLPLDSNSVTEVDIDSCRTSTSKKIVASSTLERAQSFSRGHASTGGWWPGIPSGETLEFSHLLLVPSDALTHIRERLIEVEYTIRVGLNAGSLTTDICVDLPIRIINLISLDPPPTFALPPPNTRMPNPVLESHDEDCGDRDSECSDASDEGFHDEDPQDEAQLGNLSLCDDAEDLVHHAIVAARTDNGSEKAIQNVKYDLHAIEDLTEDSEELDTPSASICSEPEAHPTPSQDHTHTSRPTRPRGPSSFALRVQKKLEVAATTRKPLTPAAEQELVSEANEAAPPAGLDVFSLTPPRRLESAGSAISTVSGYQVASSSFLNDRYFGAAPNSAEPTGDTHPTTGSRVLPRPPSIVGLPFPQTTPSLSDPLRPVGLGIATFGVVDQQTAQMNASPKPPVTPKRPSIAPGPSASSVKAKIKELEQRVRAAEGY
ncbi:hypothetical protein C8F04DRAFT_1178165 [Mycena alexandri]|uniref:Arrestin C-terminal-like domain-containing protein n=1 Tax=Mycena alexandri TaxID=1745969 RepID=A0AAD6XA35_9AGAR|nr:hypothetical protein C8F04DRAFT_1178165 [Mycena alexandri]